MDTGSPAIDAGDNALVPSSLVTDLDGNYRVENGTVDMGVYEHGSVPLVMGDDGHKLSKQDRAHPVRPSDPLPALLSALDFLGQCAPPDVPASVEEFWRWAIDHWDISRVPKPAE